MKKFKIGDNVKVILGKSKGQTGAIKSLSSKTGKVVIEGINTKIKHVKPTRKDEAGKIIQFEQSLYSKPLVVITYFVIPTLSGDICCGRKQRKLARKNFDL